MPQKVKTANKIKKKGLKFDKYSQLFLNNPNLLGQPSQYSILHFIPSIDFTHKARL